MRTGPVKPESLREGTVFTLRNGEKVEFLKRESWGFYAKGKSKVYDFLPDGLVDQLGEKPHPEDIVKIETR